MFERPLYQASIRENVRPGHSIINVVFNGSLASYELIPQDNACWRDFDVNRKSGLVTNKVRIQFVIYKIKYLECKLGIFQSCWEQSPPLAIIKSTLHSVNFFSHSSWVGNLFHQMSGTQMYCIFWGKFVIQCGSHFTA